MTNFVPRDTTLMNSSDTTWISNKIKRLMDDEENLV